MKTAAARRGLDDYGDPAFREPLRLLFEAYEHDAHLTPFGRMGVRRDTLRLLENRLAVEDALKRNPEIGKGEIRAPLFVLGLPRTGTSILHELLAQDPANRTPMTWETNVLFPPPERATFETDPRIALAEQHYAGLDQVLPEFKQIHRDGRAAPAGVRGARLARLRVARLPHLARRRALPALAGRRRTSRGRTGRTAATSSTSSGRRPRSAGC